MIYVLAIFCLFVSAHANLSGPCPDKVALQNFNLNDYLGKWYEIESFGNFLERFSVKCPMAEYTLNKTSGNVNVKNSGILKLSGLEVIFRAEGYPVSPGKLRVEYTQPESGKTVSAPYYVLGTDYNNWAIVYSCLDYEIPLLHKSVHYETSWILSRKRYDDVSSQVPDEVKKQIDEAVQKSDLSRESYVKSDQTKCVDYL